MQLEAYQAQWQEEGSESKESPLNQLAHTCSCEHWCSRCQQKMSSSDTSVPGPLTPEGDTAQQRTLLLLDKWPQRLMVATPHYATFIWYCLAFSSSAPDTPWAKVGMPEADHTYWSSSFLESHGKMCHLQRWIEPPPLLIFLYPLIPSCPILLPSCSISLH